MQLGAATTVALQRCCQNRSVSNVSLGTVIFDANPVVTSALLEGSRWIGSSSE